MKLSAMQLKLIVAIPVLLGSGLLSGCHSPYMNATVENRTGESVSPIEVDYPSASFGTETLPSGATFKYRFKVLGSGGTKLVWTDASQRDHTAVGPPLREGAEGTLLIVMSPTGVSWTPKLKP